MNENEETQEFETEENASAEENHEANEPTVNQESPSFSADSLEDEFNKLMNVQDKMQKELEGKDGNVVSVDDTLERVERQTQIASEGKRKGKKFEPTKGVAMFMVKQNAKYKAQGKIQPYSNDCVKKTLARENGLLTGKA